MKKLKAMLTQKIQETENRELLEKIETVIAEAEAAEESFDQPENSADQTDKMKETFKWESTERQAKRWMR